MDIDKHLRFEYMDELSPAFFKKEIHLSGDTVSQKEELDNLVKRIINGTDKRPIIIIGPYFHEDTNFVLGQCNKISALQRRFGDKLLILADIRPETPADSITNAKEASELIISMRSLLARIITETGVGVTYSYEPCFLPYFMDMISFSDRSDTFKCLKASECSEEALLRLLQKN